MDWACKITYNPCWWETWNWDWEHERLQLNEWDFEKSW